MRRIQIVTVFALILATLIFAFSQTPTPSPQRGGAATLRRIQVNAKAVSALPKGKKYVVDLTQRGVKYEFDPKAGQMDFSRVMVRTARGDVTMASFLEKFIPKDKLAGFKYSSQSFSLGTRLPGTVQTPFPNTSKITICSGFVCTCSTESECQDLLDSRICPGTFVCVNTPNGVYCECNQKA